MPRSLLLASAFLFAVTSSLRAGDDKKKSDPDAQPGPQFKAPQPKAIPGPTPQTVLVAPYQRTDTRDVWQHYAPNRMGRMVPRVIVTPYGAVYSRTGEPYPWAGVEPRALLPIIVD